MAKDKEISAYFNVVKRTEELKKEFPKLIISRERPWWLKVAFSLPILRNMMLETYTQGIRNGIYLTTRWDRIGEFSQLEILEHERVHLLQFKKYGALLFSFLYLFTFFPAGLAYFRAKFEREAMAVDLKVRVKNRGVLGTGKERMRHHWLEVLTGRSYLYAWPFKKMANKWFEEAWEAAIKEG